MRPSLRIACAVVVGLAASGAAWAQAQKVPPANPSQVSIERQLQLKRKLLMGSESLATTLHRNMAEWEKLTPEQRQYYRETALGFRDASPEEQKAILETWSNFLELSEPEKAAYRERAKWLKAVVDSLTPQQKADLQKLSLADRARELLRLKAQMQQQGKLPADGPTTAPAAKAGPTTAPAK